MTAQAPEVLIVRGRRLALYGTPLDAYLARLPKVRRPRFAASSTALWRGYIGTWAIRDGALWLEALEGDMRQGDEIVEATLTTAFPWVKGPLKATFFTGDLRCPEGAQIDYVHHPFASPFERDRVFWINKGTLEAERLILNPPFLIEYNIHPDGSRTIVHDGVLNDKDAVDLYAPEETPRAARFWRQAADHLESLDPEEDEPVHVGGYTTFR